LEPYEMVFPRRKPKNNYYQSLVQQYEHVQERDIDEVERQKNIVEVMHNR
jgi:hypothetical protein